MKSPIIVSLAIALLGALSPVLADPVNVRVDVDRGILPANSVERAIVKISLASGKVARRQRVPVNLALVIDRSGSMQGDKIAQARDAAIELVRRLDRDDIVSLVAYDSRAEVVMPAQRVGDGRALEHAIRGLRPAGQTALYAGVTAGAQEIRRNLEDRRFISRVILLSDGLANSGPSSPDELARVGTSLLKEGISVSTIGLGLGYNEDLMTRLAKCSDGNTYFVEDGEDLPAIFAAELRDVTTVVARRVALEVEFPEWVRPLGFVGREGTIHGRRAELTLNQIYGEQEKFALVEVEVSPSAAGVEKEIARAKVSYEDASTQRAVTATASRKVGFSANRAATIASADRQVQVDYAANVMAVAKDEAVALVDSNRRDQAARVMRERASELKRMAETYGNAAVAASAAAAAPEADRLEREGLDNEGRKIYRTDAAQVRSQQAAGISIAR